MLPKIVAELVTEGIAPAHPRWYYPPFGERSLP